MASENERNEAFRGPGDAPAETGIDAAQEASYGCWACGEEIVIPVDIAMGSHQDYVEDCPVCCRPNEIHVELESTGVRCWSVEAE